MDINELTDVICSSIDCPIFVCSEKTQSIINCNIGLTRSLGYSHKDQIISQTLSSFIENHFISTELEGLDKNENAANHIESLTYVKYHLDQNIKLGFVKVKSWMWFNEIYFSVSFIDNRFWEHEPQFKFAATNEKEVKNDFSDNYVYCSPTNRVLFGINPNQNTPIDIRQVLHRATALMDTIPCCLFATDSLGNTCYVNNVYKQVTGVFGDENWTECCHPQDLGLYLKAWKESYTKGVPLKNFSLRMRFHPSKQKSEEDNPYRQYTVNVWPIWDQSKTSIINWIGTCTDIQDLQDARELNKLKSNFLSVMSHEIRTPLFGIIGSASLLMDSPLNSEQKENLFNINRSAQLLLIVIQDILDFSKIESEKLSLNPEPFALCDLFNDIEAMFKTQVENKGIKMIIHKPIFSHKILGDSGRLLQILVNLTSNAVKFTKEGSITITCNYEIDEANGLIEMEASVEDTGIGIPPETIPNLFSPWTQAHNTRSQFVGSGLGLCICKSLIGLMQGSIGINSQMGQGTNCWFKVNLPIVPNVTTEDELVESKSLNFPLRNIYYSHICQICETDFPSGVVTDSEPSKLFSNSPESIKNDISNTDSKMAPENSIHENGGFPRKIPRTSSNALESKLPPNLTTNEIPKYRLLIAEDNKINQKIITKYLKKIPYVDFIIVDNGELALDKYNNYPMQYFDLILLDHLMPVMDGDECCKLIKLKDKTQTVIGVSANALPSDLEYYKEIGMDDFIGKPFTFYQFKELIDKWLHGRDPK